MPPTLATPEMLAEMSACAYRLGMAFGREAERAEEPGRQLAMFQLFDRCFFAVRVATALQLRLRREAGAAQAREPAGEAEALGEHEALETERPERDEPGRERLDADRETERASLPILLTTLTGVAADAAALPGRRPAGRAAHPSGPAGQGERRARARPASAQDHAWRDAPAGPPGWLRRRRGGDPRPGPAPLAAPRPARAPRHRPAAPVSVTRSSPRRRGPKLNLKQVSEPQPRACPKAMAHGFPLSRERADWG